MLPDPSVNQLSQAIAPAFLLGALAAFVSLLTLRMNRVVDRSQMLNAIDHAGEVTSHLKTDLPRVRHRAILLNNALFFGRLTAIYATLLVMVAFVSAFFSIQHERGIAVLFVSSRETRIALTSSIITRVRTLLAFEDQQ